MNIVDLEGYLTTDTMGLLAKDGLPLCTITVAVEHYEYPPVDPPHFDFFDVVCWNNTYKYLRTHGKKGEWIIVRGALNNNTHFPKDHPKYGKLEIHARDVRTYPDKKRMPAEAEKAYREYLFSKTRDCGVLSQTSGWNETDLQKALLDPFLEEISKKVPVGSFDWEGTPTELVSYLGLDIHPFVLSTKLRIRSSRLLNEYGIRYEDSKKHERQNVRLCRET